MELKTLHYIEGNLNIKVWFNSENATSWITIKGICQLYGKSKSTISRALKELPGSGSPDFRLIVAENATIATISKGVQPSFYPLSVLAELDAKFKTHAGRKLLAWFEDQELNQSFENPHPVCVFEDEGIAVDVTLSPEEETVWLTQTQIAELFEVSRQNAAKHIQNVFDEGELDASVSKYYLHTATDGKQYQTTFYNLDMILAVGYRVKGKRAIAFRRWASRILKDYLIRGYAVNVSRIHDHPEILDHLSSKVLSLEQEAGKSIDILRQRIQRLESLFEDKPVPKESLFYANQFYDARLFFIELIQKAKQRILVIDPYADRALLSLLREKKREVSLTVISGGVSRLNEEDRSAFAEQYGPFDYRVITDVHDRFLLIDESMYLLGASFNAIGKRLFGVVELASALLKQSLLTHVGA